MESSSKLSSLPPSFILWSPSDVAALNSVGVMGRLVGQRALHNKASKYSTSSRFGFPFYLPYYAYEKEERYTSKEEVGKVYSPFPSNIGSRDIYSIEWKKNKKLNKKRKRIGVQYTEGDGSIDSEFQMDIDHDVIDNKTAYNFHLINPLLWIVYQDLWEYPVKTCLTKEIGKSIQNDEEEVRKGIEWERRQHGGSFWWLRCGAAYGSHFMIYDHNPNYSHAPVGVLILSVISSVFMPLTANPFHSNEHNKMEGYVEDYEKDADRSPNTISESNDGLVSFPFSNRNEIYNNIDTIRRKTYGQLIPHLRLLHANNKRLVLSYPLETSNDFNKDSFSEQIPKYKKLHQMDPKDRLQQIRSIEKHENTPKIKTSRKVVELAYVTLKHVAFYSS